MKKLTIMICLSIMFLITGCSTKLTSNVAPGSTFEEMGKTFVVRFGPDKRELNSIIADKLTLMGYPAVAGEASNIPADVNTLVTYQDNWQWDITNYMIKIKIQFRDGKSRELIIEGVSYRTSLVRKSPEEMIEETLIEMFKKKS